jgi:NAD(P)-dependent dehydrogenase (short-subunit alcohol dehydrogenase family)
MAPWVLEDAGRLDGRVAVVTGANSGVGFATAAGLRSLGARVLLACRNLTKADEAAQRLVALGPGPAPLVIRLDLEDLDSVLAAASEVTASVDRVDLLINNAGVMSPTGPDAARRQLWANHLGHVALSAALLGQLADSGGRIVVVSSLVHRLGRLDPAAPLAIENQSSGAAYASTKLMNLLFCFEADRRLRNVASAASIRAAHPGSARSQLMVNGPTKGRPRALQAMLQLAAHGVSQSAGHGALSSLRAAIDPAIPPGGYVGPSGPFEMWGSPEPVKPAAKATDAALAAALFDASLEAVGARWGS